MNKEEEDAALSALLRDDFLDDSELGDGFDDNMVMQPIQLPKSSLGMQNWVAVKEWDISCGCFCFYNYLDASVKEEGDNIGIKSESKPTITVEGVNSMCKIFRNF